MKGIICIAILFYLATFSYATEDERGPALSIAANSDVIFCTYNFPLVLQKCLRYCNPFSHIPFTWL